MAFSCGPLLTSEGASFVVAPEGCALLWGRMAHFGDTIAHLALLGVSPGAVLGNRLGIGVFAVTAAAALVKILLERDSLLGPDSLPGVFSHTSLALGLVVLPVSASGHRNDLTGF